MKTIVNTDTTKFTQYQGEFYWYRVTSFSGVPTNLKIDGQNARVLDSLITEETARVGNSKPWKTIELQGVITIDVGENPDEKFPGPVNQQTASGLAVTSIQTAAFSGQGGSFQLSVGPAGVTVGASDGGILPEGVNPDTTATTFIATDSIGRTRTDERGSDFQVQSIGAVGAAATVVLAAGGAGVRRKIQGGTVSMVGMAVAGAVSVTLFDNATPIWSGVLGGPISTQSQLTLPKGLMGSANAPMSLTISAGVAGAIQAVSFNGINEGATP